jgi:tRNA U34 5-carboxymethylaminomethyl modifying GTPase MnmE/TrmE
LESALGFLEAFLDTRGALRVLNLIRRVAWSTHVRPRVGVEDVVLGAEELRYAAQAIGKISGLVDVEDVLDVIFHQFCIGK